MFIQTNLTPSEVLKSSNRNNLELEVNRENFSLDKTPLYNDIKKGFLRKSQELANGGPKGKLVKQSKTSKRKSPHISFNKEEARNAKKN
jgi:hypothetical protein